MSGDDKITSNGVLRRCFQLDILCRRCSSRVSKENSKDPSSLQGLAWSITRLVGSFFIGVNACTNRAKRTHAAGVKTTPRGVAPEARGSTGSSKSQNALQEDRK